MHSARYGGENPAHLERRVYPLLRDVLAEEPIIVVTGPRAVGKTTLARRLAIASNVELVDFGDDDVFSVATQDLNGYLDGLADPIIIDEYQRAPAILRVAKRSVDRSPRAGAFVLTGSTIGELLPKSESLAGRSHEMVLWGLSQGELEGCRERFVELLFEGAEALGTVRDTKSDRASYIDRIIKGGYPEALRREREASRQRWFNDYVRRVVDRDLAELVALRQPASLRKVFQGAAANTAQVFNLSALAQSLGLNRALVTNYIELLERIYLLERIPAFSRNRAARAVKHPKIHVADSGLAAAMNAVDSTALRRSSLIGPLMESFVVGELRKQLSWRATPTQMFHYRDHAQREVDIVLEAHDGKCVGIEVKSSVAVDEHDALGLQTLAQALGDDFICGVVLYTGASTIQLGKDPRIKAMPISSLWLA
jgi:uncharacterized protein